jgi:hypothetical protein
MKGNFTNLLTSFENMTSCQEENQDVLVNYIKGFVGHTLLAKIRIKELKYKHKAIIKKIHQPNQVQYRLITKPAWYGHANH